MIDPVKQIIVVRKDLINDEKNPMTPGKMAAQVAHASIAPLLEIARGQPYEEAVPPKGSYSLTLDLNEGQPLKEWLEKDFRKIVLYAKSEEKLLKCFNELKEAGFVVSLIKDSGLTIFDKPTITCFGVEPLYHSVINPYVKRLQLLK
jgi:peptidyl-tRNA hydrolase